MNKLDLRLYGIIDPQIAQGRHLGELALAAVKGGATLLQYRDKTAGTREMIEHARSIKAALAGSNVPLLINDRVDVALAARADGVHIGQKDMNATDARAILGPLSIIGITINNADHATETIKLPVDYACIGSVFPTNSKSDIDTPIGVRGLGELIALIRHQQPFLPIGAIAGIDATNAASVIAAGADGVAVISALFAHEDVCEAATALRSTLDAALRNRHN